MRTISAYGRGRDGTEGKDLFSAEVLCGIELDGGDDEYFGDDVL